MPSAEGRTAVSGNWGHYRGENGFSFSITHRLRNIGDAAIVLNGAVGSDFRGEGVGARAGFGVEF